MYEKDIWSDVPSIDFFQNGEKQARKSFCSLQYFQFVAWIKGLNNIIILEMKIVCVSQVSAIFTANRCLNVCKRAFHPIYFGFFSGIVILLLHLPYNSSFSFSLYTFFSSLNAVFSTYKYNWVSFSIELNSSMNSSITSSSVSQIPE